MYGIDQAITLIILILVFAVVAYGIHWVCISFGMPQPVMWICGAVLLIVLLVFTARQLGLGGGMPHGIIK
jgi:hypothetical protein